MVFMERGFYGERGWCLGWAMKKKTFWLKMGCLDNLPLINGMCKSGEAQMVNFVPFLTRMTLFNSK